MRKVDLIHSSRGRAVRHVLLLGLAVLNGCSGAGVPFDGDVSAVPSPVLQLSWVKAKRTVQGLEVQGQIQQVHCCHYLRGHIHFEAKGPDGVSLASANAPWGEFNPRQLHSAWFKAILPTRTDARISRVEIEFIAEPAK